MHRESEQQSALSAHHPASLPDEALITSKQLALWLGRTEGHLEVCRSQGRGFPFIRLQDGGIRYRVGSVRRILAELAEYTGTHQYPARAKPGATRSPSAQQRKGGE